MPTLDLPKASFDGVWIDGRLLTRFNRKDLLEEVRRVLKPTGLLHIHAAPALGSLLQRLDKQSVKTAAPPHSITALRETLLRGPDCDLPGHFFTGPTIKSTFRRLMYDLDTSVGLNFIKVRSDEAGPMELLRADPMLHAAVSGFRQQKHDDGNLVNVGFVSFNARPRQ